MEPMHHDIETVSTAKPDNVPYIMAVVIMMAISVIGIVIISVVRPDQDNTGLIAALFAFLTPTTLSLLSFMKAGDTHELVNGQMAAFRKELIKSSEGESDIARAEGVVEGKVSGAKTANDRTDELNKTIV